MADTTLHELCKGFGALLSRSKVSRRRGEGWAYRVASVLCAGGLSVVRGCDLQASLRGSRVAKALGDFNQ